MSIKLTRQRRTRDLRYRLRAAWQWRRQGRPVDVPVVMEQGRLLACPHGKGVITDWSFDLAYMLPNSSGFIELDGAALWERWSARYPVERVPSLAGCTFCRAVPS